MTNPIWMFDIVAAKYISLTAAIGVEYPETLGKDPVIVRATRQIEDAERIIKARIAELAELEDGPT